MLSVDTNKSYAKVNVATVSDDYFVDGEDTVWYLADDCAIYQINSAKDRVSNGSLKEDRTVQIFLNDDGDVEAIFIWHANNFESLLDD